MLTNIRRPLDALRVFVGAVLLAFVVTTSLVFTYILLLPLLSFFVPAVVDSLPYFLDALTEWTSINVGRDGELFATLSVRAVVMGTVTLTLAFLLRLPAKMIERGVAGDFKTSKIISLKWYGRVVIGCLLFSLFFGILHANFNEAGTSTGVFFALIVVSGLTGLLSLIHCFLLFFLLGFWNLGCEFIHPFLRLDK